MKRVSLRTLGLLAVLGSAVTVAGCDLLTSAVRFDLRGTVAYSGNVPQDDVQLRVTLYRYLDNVDALDTSACPGAGEACYGELNVDLLGEAVVQTTVPASQVVYLEGVKSDIGYFLVVEGVSTTGNCSSDVLGYDENTKLVTRSSVISPLDNPELALSGVIDLPRPINISCSTSDIPDENDTDPVPVPDDDTDGDGENDNNLPDPPAAPLWVLFELREKSGTVLADASTTNVAGDDSTRPCGESIPLDIFGALQNADGIDQAYIHIQEGFGSEAIVRDQIVPLVDGRIDAQTIQLSGGYARLQLDLAPIATTDFEGASHYIEVCGQGSDFDWPTQEFLMVTSWDTYNTDVDSHVWVDDGTGAEDHIWYARKQGNNAELDVDDVDGYGPETITSNGGRSGLTYDVRLHYYSDHGNSSPQTNPTVRVIYANETANVFCDVTRTVPNFLDGAWANIGVFGPNLVDLAVSNPTSFTSLGCHQPE